MNGLVKIALSLVAIYAIVVVAAWAGQRRLMYFPDRARASPADHGLPQVVELELVTVDGERVRVWYGRAAEGQPTLLYFHGNAGSFPDRANRMRDYLARGRGVFMMTYRGFGGSSGKPSESANVADALLAYDALRSRGVAPRDIIVYGESLGSGIAVQVAALREVGGVILDAPYTSTVDVGVKAYPFLPVRWLMADRYETLTHLPRVSVPLLVVHGDRDRVIPVSMGQAVFEAAGEPKRLVILRGAGHTDHASFGSFEAIQRWLDEVRTGGPRERRAVEMR
jgi:hypothetical protein